MYDSQSNSDDDKNGFSEDDNIFSNDDEESENIRPIEEEKFNYS
jgi:hypothetical protein